MAPIRSVSIADVPVIVAPAELGVCPVSMCRGRPNILNHCQGACKGTGQYGVPKTERGPCVLMFQCKFLSGFCPSKRMNAEVKVALDPNARLAMSVNSLRSEGSCFVGSNYVASWPAVRRSTSSAPQFGRTYAPTIPLDAKEGAKKECLQRLHCALRAFGFISRIIGGTHLRAAAAGPITGLPLGTCCRLPPYLT
jgi:hypothetical protein